MLRRNARVGRSSARPSYVFSGLLICAACGRPVRASKTYGVGYYGCRRDVADDARCPGSRKTAREDRLLPWASALFERLESTQLHDFADAVKTSGSRPRQSPEALAQRDSTVERLGFRYCVPTRTK
jgi:Recombinase zinc beta ribbon domain